MTARHPSERGAGEEQARMSDQKPPQVPRCSLCRNASRDELREVHVGRPRKSWRREFSLPKIPDDETDEIYLCVDRENCHARFWAQHFPRVLPEVVARYTRWEEDVTPVVDAYGDLTHDQVKFMRDLAKQSPGWIINRSAVRGLDLPPVYPECRPDRPVSTGGGYWDYHPDVPPGPDEQVLIPGGPSEGKPLVPSRIHSAAERQRHIAGKKHGGANVQHVHYHPDEAKYVFCPNRKKEVRPEHGPHDEVFGAQPEDEAIHLGQHHPEGEPGRPHGYKHRHGEDFADRPDALERHLWRSPHRGAKVPLDLEHRHRHSHHESTSKHAGESGRFVDHGEYGPQDKSRADHESDPASKHRAKRDPVPVDVPHTLVRKVKDDEEQIARRIDLPDYVWPAFIAAERVMFGMEGCIKADAMFAAGEAVASVPSVTLWEADELDDVCERYLRDKIVCLVPDADGVTNPKVVLQAQLLRTFLWKRGVATLIAAPPTLPDQRECKCKPPVVPKVANDGISCQACGGYLKGVDDYLAAGGEIERLHVAEWIVPTKDSIRERLLDLMRARLSAEEATRCRLPLGDDTNVVLGLCLHSNGGRVPSTLATLASMMAPGVPRAERLRRRDAIAERVRDSLRRLQELGVINAKELLGGEKRKASLRQRYGNARTRDFYDRGFDWERIPVITIKDKELMPKRRTPARTLGEVWRDARAGEVPVIGWHFEEVERRRAVALERLAAGASAKEAGAAAGFKSGRQVLRHYGPSRPEMRKYLAREIRRIGVGKAGEISSLLPPELSVVGVRATQGYLKDVGECEVPALEDQWDLIALRDSKEGEPTRVISNPHNVYLVPTVDGLRIVGNGEAFALMDRSPRTAKQKLRLSRRFLRVDWFFCDECDDPLGQLVFPAPLLWPLVDGFIERWRSEGVAIQGLEAARARLDIALT
jgi:hypothetical protein